MINRGAITEYDRFWQGIKPSTIKYSDISTGLWGRARVVEKQGFEPPSSGEFDIIIAGGGPWGTLLGSILAQMSYSVLILDKNSFPGIGSTWNLSRKEFEELKSSGALPPSAFDEMIMGEYTEGIFSFIDKSYSPPNQRDFHFDEILNISMDEVKFQSTLAQTPGLIIKKGQLAELELISPAAAYVRYGESIFLSRLFIDARGWSSPLGTLANPERKIESIYNMIGFRTNAPLPRTVSTATGRPIGIIGATYEDEIDSPAGPVQPILERFTDYIPGIKDAGDVVYYFTRTSSPAAMTPMMNELLERVQQILPGFKEEMVERTYFGHMPAWLPRSPFSRFRLQTSAGDRILLVGAAAFQYNGLTGCAFCSLARNALSLCKRIDQAMKRNQLNFRNLNSIDIDPRERISMEIGGLFGGTMALGEDEGLGTVNRDWISFSEAAEEMDQHLKNEAFSDKIRLTTLNQLVAICARHPKVIRALLRNNRGHIGTVIWTFFSSYVKLLIHELGLLSSRRKGKYLWNGSLGLIQMPLFAINTARVWIKGRTMNKGGKMNKGGSNGRK